MPQVVGRPVPSAVDPPRAPPTHSAASSATQAPPSQLPKRSTHTARRRRGSKGSRASRGSGNDSDGRAVQHESEHTVRIGNTRIRNYAVRDA